MPNNGRQPLLPSLPPNFTFGFMLHHFAGGRHPAGQGALDADQFAKMLDSIGKGRLMNAQDWAAAYRERSVPDGAVCLAADVLRQMNQREPADLIAPLIL